MKIPSLILKQLYTFNSLKNIDGGVKFTIKNRLSDAAFTGLAGVKIEGQTIPLSNIQLQLADGTFVEHCFCVISRP